MTSKTFSAAMAGHELATEQKHAVAKDVSKALTGSASDIYIPEQVVYHENSTCERRRTYQAMISVADNVTGLVVQLLKEKGMWENTLIVVSSDNGGARCKTSNYPLKGAKKRWSQISGFCQCGCSEVKFS